MRAVLVSLQYSANVGHVISVTVNNPKSSPSYRFDLVNLCFREQVIPVSDSDVFES